MKKVSPIIFRVGLLIVGCFVGFIGFNFLYSARYAHQHCIKAAGIGFRMYAEDSWGKLPYSSNGFGNAMLLLAGTPGGTNDYSAEYIHCLCGPDDDGGLLRNAFTNRSVMSEELCTRVYIQGLCQTNDSRICILFDRNSHRGGDHFRSPWAARLREVCFLDGSTSMISDENWPAFCREQVELLVAAGFAKTNALRFYPVAR